MIFFNSSKYIIGVDEAGRGCIAGPVVAAACIFFDKSSKKIPTMIRDSKKMSKKARNDARFLLEEISWYGIGVVDVEVIEKINILNASMLAMRIAIENLMKKIPNYIDIFEIIVDGNRAPNSDSLAIIKGDDRYFEISAASIFAKTHRDFLMLEYSKKFPEYGFDKHFGYGTRMHYTAIKEIGVCKIHRKNWIRSDFLFDNL